MMVECVWRMAFGSPVVPDVKYIAASSSSDRRTPGDRGLDRDTPAK
jgi:hypothetical protein